MTQGRKSQRYLSGRSKIIGFSGLSTDRHLYVEPGQVEPNLGFPGEKSLPASGTYYKLITVPNGNTYDRYWQEDTPATLVNGITIFDEGTLVGTANTVSKLNFVGAAVTATASGTISTITVTPVSISTLAPPNARSGDLWWDSDEGELNVYYQDVNSAQWVLANSGIGTTTGSGGGGGGGGSGANVTVSSNPPGTASNGDTSLVVADATNIAVGDAVFGTGIRASATVSAISGTTVTLSSTTTAAISGGEINFVDADGLGAQVLLNGSGSALAAGATTIVVDANTNISVGDIVEVAGVTAGTTVTGISGTSITISAATTAAIADNTSISFLPADSEVLNVGSTAGFTEATADAPGKFKLGDEIITYTGKTATTLTGITRGAENTESKAVAAGASISLFDSVVNLGLSNRTTDVNSAVNATATTITVDSTADFEDSGFIRIGNEVISYTGKTATSFTGLTRGVAGTTAAAHSNDAVITQEISNTDDWVDENDPALRIAYDISGQNFTLQGIPSKIGTSTSSKMFSFSAYGPGEGSGANAIGLKTLSNKASSNIGGGAVLKAESVLFTGDQIAADTQQAFGVEVSYNNLTRKFSIASGTTGENIPANSAVGVGDAGQASSNIEIGRLAIVDGVATASAAGIGELVLY